MLNKITIKELRERLHNETVSFQYTKKDGTIREAKGTLDPMKFSHMPNGGKNNAKNAGYVIYFDVDSDEFRCFAPNAFLGVVEG